MLRRRFRKIFSNIRLRVPGFGELFCFCGCKEYLMEEIEETEDHGLRTERCTSFLKEHKKEKLLNMSNSTNTTSGEDDVTICQSLPLPAIVNEFNFNNDNNDDEEEEVEGYNLDTVVLFNSNMDMKELVALEFSGEENGDVNISSGEGSGNSIDFYSYPNRNVYFSGRIREYFEDYFKNEKTSLVNAKVYLYSLILIHRDLYFHMCDLLDIEQRDLLVFLCNEIREKIISRCKRADFKLVLEKTLPKCKML